MNDNRINFDSIDLRIINVLQKEAGLPQREIAARAGLSQNACWRRLQRLEAEGILRGAQALVDFDALGLELTVFVMIRTRHHARDWATEFAAHVAAQPEVVDFHRIGGDWDYLIKVVTDGMGGYDRFYQRLIAGFDFATVTGLFSMERILDNRPPDLTRLVFRRR